MTDEHGLPPPPHKKDGKKGFLSGLGKGIIVGLIITGVVIMALGGFLGHTMDQVWKYPMQDDQKYDADNDGDPDGDTAAEVAATQKQLNEDQDSFEDRRTWDRALEWVGTLLFLLGMMLLLIGLLLGGLVCSDLPDVVRLGCIVAVGFLVFFWI